MSQTHPHILEHIYDAALQQSCWPGAIDNLADHLDARAGALLVHDPSITTYSINALSSVYMDLMTSGSADLYLETLAKYEAEQWKFIGLTQVGAILRDEEMGVSKADLDEREDYVFLREEAGILRRLAFRLNDNQGWFDGMTIGFPSHVERVPDSSIEKLSPFLPHLAKAVEIGRTFARLQVHYKAVLTVLDKVSIGLFLTLENGEVILANREAQRILSLQDGLIQTPSNRLVVRDATLSARLQKCINEVARTAGGQAERAQYVLRIPRPSLAHPFLLEVTPLRDANDELGDGFFGALVIVVDPESPFDFNISLFGVFYQLTKSETEVCDLLVRGFQTGQIAEMRGTHYTTAKNQIASVYQKTGTRRRGELVRLVVKTLPPVI
ncbi:putative Bacterial regulatory proteins, luxR family [Roseovarius sp. EC-HK134]|uniref:helix-turn-helix transcriptional regulator n=1 Tax=unclassified Roseovarius TaxID=2614913 RepID=UPI001253367D|nr:MULTISPECIES: helix-turn-helix transcriptional regulator [unclassified Roseovarius]VVT16182.1 putative Bacterial regulatory proteins, luxR family [Roseovarius sp. EC-HK134]VVT16777.1 putative Bacterial regulatory proteins, luxR family [Roseovarius sp. EC-SD190]